MNSSETKALEISDNIAMRQIAEICQKAVPGKLKIPFDGSSFSLERKADSGGGIMSIHAERSDEIVSVSIEIARAPEEKRVPIGLLSTHFSELREMVRIIPRPKTRTEPSLWLGLSVKASPMSLARSSVLFDELIKIDNLAKTVQSYLPAVPAEEDLQKLYSTSATLTPVYPWKVESDSLSSTLHGWAEDVLDILNGGASVALSCTDPVTLDFSLALLAAAIHKGGLSLGSIKPPVVDSKNLIEIVTTAPGFVAVPVLKLSLGTNAYEMGNEMRSLLSTLTETQKPAVFTGNHGQLQAVFHGGQGGGNDPLFPVICHTPTVPIEVLVYYSIDWAGRLSGGISAIARNELASQLLDAVMALAPEKRLRVLPTVARRMVKGWMNGKTVKDAPSYALKVGSFSETLGGISPGPRAKRSAEVQQRLISTLTDPELLPYLKSELLAQDRALEQLVSRLTMECLTRPAHQPLRYCVQGTPGTGKSESAALIAERLGVPLVNIDAASIPDYYTAAAQLLGSGRGIVGSYQSGRLEQAAKHHAGVIIEVSDLDHATPAVRSALADLFLQVLEVGEATSAVGATFSCANVIFAFTMNLPNGMDELVRRTIGFAHTATERDVAARVSNEIKDMLSSAFLSRVGTPILFDPLDGKALGRVVEVAIRKAITAATERMGHRIEGVEVAEGTGACLMACLESSALSTGARLLLEQGRTKAADAFMRLYRSGSPMDGRTIHISWETNTLIATT